MKAEEFDGVMTVEELGVRWKAPGVSAAARRQWVWRQVAACGLDWFGSSKRVARFNLLKVLKVEQGGRKI